MILKLKPVFKDYIWGGNKLKTDFGFDTGLDKTAEGWMLSCHKDGENTVENGGFEGKTLNEVIEICGREILGKNGRRFDFFPILIKLIDAKDDLSVQVHPDNDYALRVEGEYGKTIRNAIHNIDILSKNGILSFYGNGLEPFSSEMQCIKTVILARTKNKIRLITDDQNLAEDVLMLNGLNSCIGFPATVCRFAEDGSIEEWEAEEDDIRAENDQDDIFGRLRF